MKNLIKKIKFNVRKIVSISRGFIKRTVLTLVDSISKAYRLVKKCFRELISILVTPTLWLKKFNQKKFSKHFLILLCVFILVGISLNSIWIFSNFYLFIFIFLTLFLGIILSEYKYMKSIELIRSKTLHIGGCFEANTFYSKYESSKLFFFIPFAVVLIFGIGGNLIFGNVEFTPTFIWCLCFFALVVHISIIGYVQYIILMIYIGKIAKSEKRFRNLIKIETNSMPSQLDWLVEITRLSHLYRNLFFTFGCLYIIGFGLFCFLPVFNVTIGHSIFYLLWIVIFLAIVLTFPIVSVLEYQWIKEIVKRIKKSYMIDLVAENNMLYDSIPEWFKPTLQMMNNIFVNNINNTAKYPIPNKLSLSYAYVVGLLNFSASLATLLQFVNKINLFT